MITLADVAQLMAGGGQPNSAAPTPLFQPTTELDRLRQEQAALMEQFNQAAQPTPALSEALMPKEPGKGKKIAAAIADALTAYASVLGRNPSIKTDVLGLLRQQRAEAEQAKRSETVRVSEGERQAKLATTQMQLQQKSGEIASEERRIIAEGQAAATLAAKQEEITSREAIAALNARTQVIAAQIGADSRKEVAQLRGDFQKAIADLKASHDGGKLTTGEWKAYNEDTAWFRRLAYGDPLSTQPADRVGLIDRFKAGDVDPLTVMSEIERKLAFVQGQTDESTVALQNGEVAAYRAHVLPVVAAFLIDEAEQGGLTLKPETKRAILQGDKQTVAQIYAAIATMKQQAEAERAAEAARISATANVQLGTRHR